MKQFRVVYILAPALAGLLWAGICVSAEEKKAAEPAQQEASAPSEASGKEARPPQPKQRLVDVNPAARVNGETISRVELDKSYNAFIQQQGMDTQMITNPDRYKQAQMKVLDQLIDRELMWQEAQNKNLIADDQQVEQALGHVKGNFPSEAEYKLRLAQLGYTEEDYLEILKRQLSVRALIQNDIAQGVAVSDEEIHEYYQTNPDKFQQPEQVRARHILLKVKAGADEAARKEARQKMEGILSEAQGGADFAALAQKYSEGPSGPKGGDLGFFSRGQMVKPFEEAAFALKVGELSGVVQTVFGYHIIKVEEKKAAQTVAEEEVQEQVRQFLHSNKVQRAVQQRVERLRQDATIEILLP